MAPLSIFSEIMTGGCLVIVLCGPLFQPLWLHLLTLVKYLLVFSSVHLMFFASFASVCSFVFSSFAVSYIRLFRYIFTILFDYSLSNISFSFDLLHFVLHYLHTIVYITYHIYLTCDRPTIFYISDIYYIFNKLYINIVFSITFKFFA